MEHGNVKATYNAAGILFFFLDPAVNAIRTDPINIEAQILNAMSPPKEPKRAFGCLFRNITHNGAVIK